MPFTPTTEARLEALSDALNSKLLSGLAADREPTVANCRAEMRAIWALEEAAVACGMSRDVPSVSDWAAERVVAWLRSGVSAEPVMPQLADATHCNAERSPPTSTEPDRETYRPLPGETTPGWTTAQEAANWSRFCDDDLVHRYLSGQCITNTDRREARRLLRARAV